MESKLHSGNSIYIKGFVGGEFVGLKYFTKFINSFQFTDLIKNTFFLSFYSILAGFPVPIILALFINQIKKLKLRNSYKLFPISALHIGYSFGRMLSIFLSPSSGIVGHVYRSFGLDPINLWEQQNTLGPFMYCRIFGALWLEQHYIHSALSAIDQPCMRLRSGRSKQMAKIDYD